MARICQIPNCSNVVWGTDKITKIGYCKYHQYKRTDRKISKKYYPLKSRKPTGEKELFEEIAKERLPTSFISGIFLDLNDVRCYAHVLPKGKYPKYRLNKKNIVLLTPEEHRIFDQGTLDEEIKYSLKILKEFYINVRWSELRSLAKHLISFYPE